MSDTKQNRRETFQKCLQHLVDYVLQNKTIRKVVFPNGIGIRGKADHECKTYYLVELKDLARRLDLNNTAVVLLEQEFPWEDNATGAAAASVDVVGTGARSSNHKKGGTVLSRGSYSITTKGYTPWQRPPPPQLFLFPNMPPVLLANFQEYIDND
ncbi:hypothetical protein GWK47_021542 [Chionoecetes opilio]|uniref:Uncharacterized protein n=1 Tax=Chionoecetes opilio TaxID=41210 RepID=A0A8J4XP20_CHIOP|nr:hypothetical protein GWK47_021542 [Chionoecetes opilio]